MTSLRNLRRAFVATGLAIGASLAVAADFQVLTAFDSKASPAPNVPNGTLTLANDGSGVLYGTTSYGGHESGAGHGTIFGLDPQGNVKVLHDFAINKEGGNPNAPLVQTADGALWGTTQLGGVNGGGTIYKLEPNGKVVVMYALGSYPDGATPDAGLMLAADGSLWGTTSYGGGGNSGTVFRIDQQGNYTLVHNFGDDPGTGTHSTGRLVQADDGSIWGTTTYTKVAGASPVGGGVVFKITPDGTYSMVRDFSDRRCPVGCRPEAGMTNGGDGWLYGTMLGGGPLGGGTVYRINDTGFDVVHAFKAGPALDGSEPFGELMRASDGSLYGTTYSGGTKKSQQGPGTVFRIDAGGAYSQLHVFQCLKTGCGPHGGLVETAPGVVAGTVPDNGNDITHGGSVWQITLQ